MKRNHMASTKPKDTAQARRKLTGYTLLRDKVEAFTTKRNVYVGSPAINETVRDGDDPCSCLRSTGRVVLTYSFERFIRALCHPIKNGRAFEITVREVKWKDVRPKYQRALKSGREF